MKSIYFSKNFIEDNDTTSLQKINELSSEQLSGVAKWFNQRDPQKNRRLAPENIHEINNLCVECNIEYTELKAINSFVIEIIERAYLYKDEVSSIIDDIAAQGAQFDKEKIQTFFDAVTAKGIEFAKRNRVTEYERRDLPILAAFRFNVSLRLIPDIEFELEATKIVDYKPEIESLLPVAIFEAVLNDGQKKSSINFQVNIDDLEEIIGQLQACQKQLRLLETVSPDLIS